MLERNTLVAKGNSNSVSMQSRICRKLKRVSNSECSDDYLSEHSASFWWRFLNSDKFPFLGTRYDRRRWSVEQIKLPDNIYAPILYVNIYMEVYKTINLYGRPYWSWIPGKESRYRVWEKGNTEENMYACARESNNQNVKWDLRSSELLQSIYWLLPMFWYDVSVPSSRGKQSKLDCRMLEGDTHRLSRNVRSYQRCVISQKSEGVIEISAETWNHAKWRKIRNANRHNVIGVKSKCREVSPCEGATSTSYRTKSRGKYCKRVENSITLVIRELDSDSFTWFEMVQNNIQWRTVVNTVANLLILDNLLIGRGNDLQFEIYWRINLACCVCLRLKCKIN